MARHRLDVGGIGPSRQGVSRRARYKIDADPTRNAQVLVVDGDVTLETLSSLEYMMGQITRPLVVIDFTNSTMLSGAAIGTLKRAVSEWSKQERDVRIVGEEGPVMKVLHTSGVAEMVRLYSTRRSALRGGKTKASGADVIVIDSKEAVTALERQSVEVIAATAETVDRYKNIAPALLLDLATLERIGEFQPTIERLATEWVVLLVGPGDREDVAEACALILGVEYIPEPVIVTDLVQAIRACDVVEPQHKA